MFFFECSKHVLKHIKQNMLNAYVTIVLVVATLGPKDLFLRYWSRRRWPLPPVSRPSIAAWIWQRSEVRTPSHCDILGDRSWALSRASSLRGCRGILSLESAEFSSPGILIDGTLFYQALSLPLPSRTWRIKEWCEFRLFSCAMLDVFDMFEIFVFWFTFLSFCLILFVRSQNKCPKTTPKHTQNIPQASTKHAETRQTYVKHM